MDSAFCLATPSAVFGSPTLFLFSRSETQQKAAFSSCSSSSSSPCPSPFGSPCKHANADALFRIDDLLDFSNYDIGGGGGDHEDFYTSRNGMDLNSSNGDEKYHCMPPPQNELYAPCDELAEQLEWLSSVVEEESQQGWSFFIPTPALQSTQKNGVEDDGIVVESFPQLEKAVTWRSRRSKRLRSYSSAWSVFQHSNREKSTSCKKMKASPGCSEPHRRCCHCQVQKTPQWRGGPMGPKTLCNACGVRYKSGRLVTEYRPAGSPTFNIQVHSNSHKKILQMRSLKSQQAQQHTAAQLQSDYELQEPNDSKTSDTFHKDSNLETTIRQPSLS